MPKLLFLISNRVGRGTYWRSFGFAQELVRRGYEVTFLAVSSRRNGFVEQAVKGVTLVETPDLLPTSGYDPWDSLNRIQWLKKRHFDLIHAFESRPVTIFPALSVQKQQQIPLVMDWCDWFGRGGSVEERPNPLLRTLLRPIETFFEENYRTRANGTTVINSVLKQKAVRLGVPAETILYLPNGATIDDIRPQNRRQVREKLGLPQDVFILGYTGAMFRSDGMLMAAAFAHLHRLCPQVRLLLIGYNNIQVEQWLSTAVTQAIIRTGPVTSAELADYVAACDIGWLTLKNNGANQGRFPMKAYDFMAAACPLVVTDVADLGALVRDKHIGLTAPDTPTELAEVTLSLLADAARQLEMGQNGRQVVETQFALPIVTATLDQFYQQILSGGKPATNFTHDTNW